MRHRIFAVAAVLGFLAVPGLVRAEDEGKLKISGDLRGRYEGFRFSADPNGAEKEDRSRLRYRFRLNAAVGINQHFGAAARITTGDGDNRSGNQTLGTPNDFSPAEFDLRRAFITYYPFAEGVLPGSTPGHWRFDFGRVANPYMWKKGPDKMVWDSDIALSGVSTVFDVMAGQSVQILAATGYYVLDENSGAQEPYLAPFQAGVVVDAGETVEFGARGTFYHYGRLDMAFIDRATDDGNIVDGLTGDPNGGTLDVVEGQGFVRLTGSEAWPVTLFGGLAQNTSAAESDSVPNAGKANNAFNAGIEVGSKKKAVRLGVAAVKIEANALVSQFIDSDVLDGVTNREGLIAYVQRTVVKNTDLGGTFFWSDAVNPDLVASAAGSKRFRVQLDLSVKF